MTIDVVEWILNENSSPTYKYYPFKYCCEKLKRSECVIFNDEVIFDQDGQYSEDPDVSFKLVKNNPCYNDDEFIDFSTWEKIKFCPFCGEEIKINKVGTVNKSSEYNTIYDRRNNLWKKYMKTDSKKRASDLNHEVRELDKQLNEMCIFGKYKTD